MERDAENEGRHVVGGVDTHKDLHVAAVVDEQDRVLAGRCFPTTRQEPTYRRPRGAQTNRATPVGGVGS